MYVVHGQKYFDENAKVCTSVKFSINSSKRFRILAKSIDELVLMPGNVAKQFSTLSIGAKCVATVFF